MNKKGIFVILLTALLTACSEDEIVGEKPYMSRDFLNTATQLTFSGKGGESSLDITANCDWHITLGAGWLRVAQASGSNSQTVVISADMNNTAADRSTVLKIKGGNLPERQITVIQRKQDSGTQIPGRDDNLTPD